MPAPVLKDTTNTTCCVQRTAKLDDKDKTKVEATLSFHLSKTFRQPSQFYRPAPTSTVSASFQNKLTVVAP